MNVFFIGFECIYALTASLFCLEPRQGVLKKYKGALNKISKRPYFCLEPRQGALKQKGGSKQNKQQLTFLVNLSLLEAILGQEAHFGGPK